MACAEAKHWLPAKPTAPEPQPGADEADALSEELRFRREAVAFIVEMKRLRSWDTITVLAAAIEKGEKAGRARGIEEERKRCEGIAREYAARAASWKHNGNGGKTREALAGETAALAIADAIAKETKRD